MSETIYRRHPVGPDDRVKPCLDRMEMCEGGMYEIVHTRVFSSNVQMDEYIATNEIVIDDDKAGAA